jgi:hypothetical protein
MENKTPSAWLPIMIILSFVFWGIVFLYFNGLRVDNIYKNKKVEELQGYKQAWVDFNKSFIPETALPRVPEIEAIYNEERK